MVDARQDVKTIIRNARVLTMDPQGTEHARATVTVQDDVITAVDAGDSPRPARPADVREIEGAGHLVMPGLVNAHFHSSVNHLKGSLDSLPLELFMLYESPSDAAVMDPRAVYVRTMLGALEMLKSGVTAVLDDAFFVPAPTAAAIDAVMQAYADSGIRATLALDQPNVAEIDKLPFLGDLLPPALRARAAAPPVMDADGLLGCYQHLLSRWHGAAEGRLRAAVSCSAPFFSVFFFPVPCFLDPGFSDFAFSDFGFAALGLAICFTGLAGDGFFSFAAVFATVVVFAEASLGFLLAFSIFFALAGFIAPFVDAAEVEATASGVVAFS